MSSHPLDNPIWLALSTTQARFAKSNHLACKFPKEVSLLGGFAEATRDSYDAMASLLEAGERVGLFLPGPPGAPSNWSVVLSIPLLQMIGEGESSLSQLPVEFARLGDADVPEMLALTKLTKPGPFGTRTHEMGDYFGIRSEGKLVAMAGERLHVPGYTEVSAVCTHPEHIGHGYAAGLMSQVMRGIRRRAEQAFLHVRPENERAIALYARLGFTKRTMLHYAILQGREG